MKTIVAFATLLFATSVLPAQTQSAAKTGAATETEEEPKIDGMVINRPDGTFLGLTLDSGKFKLSFYDKKKKPMPVDVTRAVARWPNLHGPGDNRTVLNPGGDGTFLLGAQFVRPPLVFKLFITLLKGEGDKAEAVENYPLDFHG